MPNPDDARLEEIRQLCGPLVDEQLKKGGEEGLTIATLRRWLVARKGDVKEAAKGLQAHAAWRAKYVPNGRVFPEEIKDELDQNKAFLPGFDKSGRPFCLVIVSRHHVKDAEASKRYIVYALDCATLLGSTKPGWDGKMSGIFDLRGLKASNCDLATLRNVFDLLQNHYPERLHTLWLYNAPVVFYGIYRLVYPFIDPVTREKVRFVYEKDAEAEFLAAFDREVLPSEICSKGTGRWITIKEQYDRLLTLQQQHQLHQQRHEQADPGVATLPPAQAQEGQQAEEQQQEAAGEAGLAPIAVVA
ncbi:hypothetical protein Vretimale_18506 [Volvox reticuliferus]|uniref:CRAL-TRIO domain-containing protein n=1 Tax=Volvox reticuliferus TaxID=1737510 RepID=A0A8J4GV71_9CHLO|nr:hypothetical protein Vretifemale_19662 [Volvox reticuliferus]GIM15836.1 hypothetical protein Vretimale_18506 [Volvox reticuliferus]